MNLTAKRRRKRSSPVNEPRAQSRESMRSRSKRRKKYRRRSDYAASSAAHAHPAELGILRSLRSMGGAKEHMELTGLGDATRVLKDPENVIEEEGDVEAMKGGEEEQRGVVVGRTSHG
jgi:hypothetical protein